MKTYSDDLLTRKIAIPRIKNLRDVLTRFTRNGPCWLLGHANTIEMHGLNDKGGICWAANWECSVCRKKMESFTPTKPDDTTS